MVNPSLRGVFVGPAPSRWITYPEPVPIPQPVQGWISRAWANGIAGNGMSSVRGIPNAKFGAGDKYDPVIQYSHAGSSGPYNVDGKGACQINGDRSRIYYIVRNFNAFMTVGFIPNWRTNSDDLSNRLRSRHNEGDPTTNRFGGYNFSVGPTSYEFAREDYHNVHTKFGGGNLPFRLNNGRLYMLKFQCTGIKPVQLTAWINGGNGYQLVGQQQDRNPLASGSNPSLFQQMSYGWTRNNGSGNVVVRDVGFQILP